jgi:hypothetical protein
MAFPFGILQRIIGANGKIGNILVKSRAATIVAWATAMPERPASPTPPGLGLAWRVDQDRTVELVSDPSSILFIISLPLECVIIKPRPPA